MCTKKINISQIKMLPNSIISSRKIFLEAKYIYKILTTLPEDYYSVDYLSSLFNTSKQNIETYIKELKKIIEEDIHWWKIKSDITG